MTERLGPAGSAHHTSATPLAGALTHFAGRAGDHNARAMVASRLLAAALGERYRSAPVVIGFPRPALSAGWDTELPAARAELEQMAAR